MVRGFGLPPRFTSRSSREDSVPLTPASSNVCLKQLIGGCGADETGGG